MRDVLKIIKERRSIRRFLKKEIPDKKVFEILEAARFAPSGLNNQPWRFVIIKDESVKGELAKYTEYTHLIKRARVIISVFLDRESSYDFFKDTLSIGACIQNMLLEAYSLGIGSCWVGEILKREKEVKRILGISERYKLCALVCLGYPSKIPKPPKRKNLRSLILKII